MSSDPFIFKRQKFVAMTRLKCYRNTGDVYAFVVNTRRNPTRTYKNRLYVGDSETPLLNFDMTNIGYGKSLIRFTDSNNLPLKHTGDECQVTLVVLSTSTDSLSKDSIDESPGEDLHQDAPCNESDVTGEDSPSDSDNEE